MKYVGIQTQIWRNNRNTVLLLLLFPVILLGMVLGTIMVLDWLGFFCWDGVCGPGLQATTFHWDVIWPYFLDAMPYTLGVTAIWFIIAYFANTAIIRHATHARPLERKENVRVYNIVENLCIAGGIEMPRINIVEDPNLNAFASGIDINSYTITLTTGIIDALDDTELSAVVGHELTHIKNRDTRLMVVCIVFVGIFSMTVNVLLRILSSMWRSPRPRTRRKNDGAGAGIVLVLIIALVWATIGYFFSTLTRLAISRKREYVADAGAAELCGDPLALASALRKISENPGLASVKRDDVAQLYIIHPDEESDNDMGLTGLVAKANILFCTHPDTPERIRLLEQF
ncbi:M48 family metallopeptidase [Fibrobacter sp. UWR2]|uniref:M48 family metallopeptidase n=1 Tax=Fibrobacter sp. UWR2 TaxID=1964352 RepID=UPI000B525089|nr:M48 family metallopeptidase [Fibrobacter sp. UWR2]OWU99384.1 protease [Fibrobacter sp. UWR2]